jgi:hypothetical protein
MTTPDPEMLAVPKALTRFVEAVISFEQPVR